MDMFVLVIGNPIDGLKFIGPFYTSDAAIEYADENAEDAFWITEMKNPEWEEQPIQPTPQ